MDRSLICLGNDSSFTCLFHSMSVHWPLHVHLFIRFCDLLCCCIAIFCFVASLFCHRGLLAFCLAKMHISFPVRVVMVFKLLIILIFWIWHAIVYCSASSRLYVMLVCEQNVSAYFSRYTCFGGRGGGVVRCALWRFRICARLQRTCLYLLG